MDLGAMDLAQWFHHMRQKCKDPNSINPWYQKKKKEEKLDSAVHITKEGLNPVFRC